MDKVSETPEKDLEKYFEKGASCPFKKLTKSQIKRLYFNWVKDNNDVRKFEEVFEEKLESHLKQWKKQYDIKSLEFIPVTLGKVYLSYGEGKAFLTFKSKRHMTLISSIPVRNHKKMLKWVKKKIQYYCSQNIVKIDYEKLKVDLEAPIVTTVLLY